MMIAFLSLLLMVVAAGILLSGYLFNWFQRFEKEEMRLVDLQVLASDYGVEFDRFSHRFASTVRTNHLGLGENDAEIKNVIKIDRPDYTGYLFDHRLFARTDISSAGEFSGIFIENKNQTFPTFKITRKQFLDRASYTYILPHQLPRWVPSNLSVIAHEDVQIAVKQLLHENPILELLVTDHRFLQVFFNEQYIAFYLDRLYPTYSTNFKQMLLHMERLGTVKGMVEQPEAAVPPADADGKSDNDFEINLLKAVAG